MFGLLACVVSFDAGASRKMLSSVCLLPIPLAFHGIMLSVLSVWAGLCGGEGARGCGGVIHAVQIQALALR